MLALAKSLERHGHAVTLAGPPDFVDDVAALRVDYQPMGQSLTEFLRAHSAAIARGLLPMLGPVKRGIDDSLAAQFDVLSTLAPQADVVVGASLAFAARSCAEAFGRPYRFVAFAPETFPSRHHGSPGIRAQGLPLFVNRACWWLARRIDNWLLAKALNQGRTKLGLPPVADTLGHFAPPNQSILATDEELAPAPPDVSLPAPPTGAWMLDDDRPLPAEVEAFLAAGPPPIYLGFGSMPDAHPARTADIVMGTIRALGCRAIIYSGPAGIGAPDLGPSILAVGTLPHARLLPRVALAVHHGGAGTCARAARAGIPQVIVPHVLDQFPWAARMHKRGLGPRPLYKTRLTTRALGARIRQALEDPGMRERATKLAQKLAGRDGAEQAAAMLTVL
jgi:vancomycin aglycone glucosyltransferase